MNKITKSIITTIIMLFCNQYLTGQSNPDGLSGDMGFKMSANSNYKMQVTMTCASIPFEGLTNPRDIFRPFNRVGKIQNGSIWRFFISQGTLGAERNIYKISSNIINYGEVFDLMHSSGSEYEASINYVYGYAKYLVEVWIYYNNVLSEKYRYFYNTLDSKFGAKDTISNNTYYIGDLYVQYNISLPVNRRLEIYKDVRSGPVQGLIPIDTISTADTLNDGTPKKELKVWEIKYPPSSFPEEQNFYASTTPFGLRPEVFYENAQKTELLIGTKIIFDSVYNNKDVLPSKKDTIGYNTRDDNLYHRYYTLPPVGFNDYGNTYTTTSWFNDFSGIQKGLTLIADSSTTLEYKKNKKMWVSGVGDENIYDVLILKENSKIIYYENSGLYTFNRGKIIDEGCKITWAPNTIYRAYNKTEFSYTGTSHLINNGGKVEIDSLAELHLGNNTVVTFDGSNTLLKLKPGSKVFFGQNAKIEFKNGAYLIANGSSISSINSSLLGEGIILENAGASTVITGCTFNNLTSAVTLYNDNMTSANTYRYIYGNVFNMINGNRYGLHTYNAHNSTIQNNTFNLAVGDGFGLVMRYSLPPGEDETPPIYSININNNAFNNGTVSAAFLCYTSEYVPMNVSYNNFNSASLYNVIGRHITGDIRYNTLNSVTAGSQCKSIELTQSTPGLYSNTVSSNYKNLYSYDSYENLAPIPENGNFILTGGYNRFTSIGNGNVYFYGGKALLDYGYNCFLKNINQAYNHLEGAVNEPTLLYYMRNNDFNNSNMPVHSLVEYESGSVVVPFVEGSNYTCQMSTDAGNIWIIRDLGNGVIDTIYSKPDNTGYQQPQDASLYSTATARKTGGLYFDAVSYFKALINNHAASAYTDACLYNLYECHERLDTSSSQEIRNILYGSLKIYLENKILSELYSDEFNFNAYNIVLMCETNMTDYNSAMAGYEFIALYHPEAYIRLLASWDYAELEELINGGGGLSSRNENMSDEDYLLKLTKKINKSVSEDPVRAAVKKSFNRVKSENTTRDEKEIYSRNKNTKEAENELTMMKQIEYNFNSRTLNVLRNAKTMTREEKSQRQMEDILTTLKDKKGSYADHGTNTLPENYDLSQNYPNPFNPVTKINYAIPKQGFVTLKLYDMIGREIQTLVNEVKQAGYYCVDFNGSKIASGVYFYRIQCGTFISVKKMVLVK
jgi:hypothetical protein